MKNLLEEYLHRHKLTMSAFARILKVGASTVYNWKINKMTPRGMQAWKIHKATKGEIPINYWGYIINNKGKFIKLCKGPVNDR